MKILPAALLSLVTLVASAGLALGADQPARPYLGHVNLVRGFDNTILIADGFSAEQVRRLCGRPDDILPGNVWLYRLAASESPATARSLGADTILVSFSDGARASRQKVAAIVMVNSGGVAYALNELKQSPIYLAGHFANVEAAGAIR